MDQQPWHRLSNIQPDESVGDCAVCGPLVPLKFRRHRNQWACQTSQKRRRPGWRREHWLKEVRRTIVREDFDFEVLFAEQGGTCAICELPEISGRSLAIDHCHETGRVRGLLCNRCNRALGLMKDDPERLLRAINYLAG